MAFSYLTNIPLEEARAKYLDALTENGMGPAPETVPVKDALGRVTAQPVYAHISAPHYHACAMDGIALSAALTFGASETTPVRLKPADFHWVDTGDPLPEGCDAVVMIEDVVKEDTVKKEDSMKDDSGIVLYSPSSPWEHIRQIGEDICAGEMIIPSFTEITPAAIGAMLAGGILEVVVTKKPIIGIIPTGNEIIMPVENPGKGDIQEFNSAIFSAMLEEWGAKPIVYPIVKDDLELITSALEEALRECDAVIVNAGSSAGSKDYSARAIENIGEVVCHGIAIKPGKPAILGLKGKTPIMGVPGYPVSGIIVIEQLLKPVIARLCGSAPPPLRTVKAKLSRSVMSTLKYKEYVRVHLGYVGDELIATNLNRGAGLVSSFMKADGILEIPQNIEGYQAGDEVDVRLLRRLSEIRQALVITGSHDPLIDELFELMRREHPGVHVASSHVGSMGGIMAVRNKAAHAAGVHLLDEKTGEYNIPFIKKYFPQGGVALVECAKRVQGIIVQKGNPKRIESLSDLTKKGLKFVNRQKGSGTRILCDYLCKKDGIDTKLIYGYDHEEYTHTSVAALIEAGDADAGLGIFSAANMYNLDFIPVCEEEYDFLIPESELDTEKISRMLDTLKSPAFQMRLKEMGGYILENPGKIRYNETKR